MPNSMEGRKKSAVGYIWMGLAVVFFVVLFLSGTFVGREWYIKKQLKESCINGKISAENRNRIEIRADLLMVNVNKVRQWKAEQCPTLAGSYNYILLIDNSESAKNSLDIAKGIAKHVIETSGKTGKYAVLSLDGNEGAWENGEKVLNAIDAIKTSKGGGDFVKMFGTARKIVDAGRTPPDSEYRIIFLSDGKYEPAGNLYLGGLKDGNAMAQSLALFYEHIKGKVTMPDNCAVYTLALGEDPDLAIMQKIATEGKGKSYKIAVRRDFERIFPFREG